MESYSLEAIDAFEEAAERQGLVEQWFEIAGQVVRVRLAGTAFEDYALPALDHRRLGSPRDAAALTIRVFDSASTGVAMPRPVWPRTAYLPTCEITGLGDRYLGAFNTGTGVFDLLDIQSGDAIHWIADAADHPAFESSSPFRVLFHWWLRERELQVLHGGAVGDEHGAVLLAGKGGAGKSTIAVACLIGGMRYIADDYAVVGRDPRPEAINLYQTAKLHVEDLEKRFPQLMDAVGGFTDVEGRDKAILYLAGRFPDTVVRHLPLRAVVIPRITDAAVPRFFPATERDALTALVPSVVRQLTAIRQRDTDFMADLVRALPAYVVEPGSEVAGVPDLLRGLLAKV